MQIDYSELSGLAIALALGLLVGIQRGWVQRREPAGHRFAGIRTYGLLGLAGGIAGALQQRAAPLALILMLASAAFAQAAPADKAEKKDAAANMAAPAAPNRSVTKHVGTFNGQKISYTAITGETFLPGADGKPRAAIFSTSYIKDGKDPNRPVTFLFNGGPGSGSVWLHMGAFGPVRVAIPSDAQIGRAHV